MSKGRKNGCPINITDWKIEIQNKGAVSETWLEINGLDTLTYARSSTTEDGSAKTDLWEEPYVSKRSAKLTLKGKRIVDASTGAVDAGQDMLDEYAENGQCDGDATVRFTDPYGHILVADYVVTDTSTEANDTDNSVSWDLQQVGEAETPAYVQVSSIALKDNNTAVSSVSLTAGGAAKVITVDFTPATASNKRFRVYTSNRHIASISAITASTFTITPITAGTATITVVTVNGGKTATLTVTVT